MAVDDVGAGRPRISVMSRGLHGHVGAGADGDADVGLRQRGGVVDAVADHGDDRALSACSRATSSALSSGSTSASTSVDARLPRRSPRRCAGCRR